MPKGRKYCSANCKNTAPKPYLKSGMTLKCGSCGIEIYKPTSQIKNTTFCSTICFNKFQSRNKLEFECKTCKIKFYWSKSRIKQHTPKYCSIQCRNQDEDWKFNAVIRGNLIQQRKKGLNKIELIGQSILKELNLNFEEQVLIANKFLVDVYISEYNLIIQWDGDYWHGHISKLKNGIPDHRQSKRMKLDISQNKYLKKCGYNILRFWEHEILLEANKKHENIKRTIRQFTDRV